jgi:uncharacterized phage protein gp47/JayE
MSTLDETGLTIDRYPEVRERLAAAVTSAFGDQVLVDDEDAIIGKLISIASETIADQNETTEGVYNAFSVNAAIGVPQDNLVALNGITRNGAQYSVVTLVLSANAAGCTVPEGALFRNPTTQDLFALDASLVLGPDATNAQTATAVVAGAITAAAGEITEIVNPQYGLSACINYAAAVPGSTLESHTSLRNRRARACKAAGSSTLAAIKAALEDIDSVDYAEVYENRGQVIDAYGIPPGYIWAIVGGGTTETIADALFAHATGGMMGNVHGGVNYDGHSYVMSWSAPVDVTVYLTLRIKPAKWLQGSAFPPNGAALIRAAIIAWFAEYQTAGVDVAAAQMAVPANTIPGYYLDSVLIGTAPTPTDTADLPMLLYQRAVVTAASVVIEVVG